MISLLARLLAKRAATSMAKKKKPTKAKAESKKEKAIAIF